MSAVNAALLRIPGVKSGIDHADRPLRADVDRRPRRGRAGPDRLGDRRDRLRRGRPRVGARSRCAASTATRSPAGCSPGGRLCAGAGDGGHGRARAGVGVRARPARGRLRRGGHRPRRLNLAQGAGGSRRTLSRSSVSAPVTYSARMRRSVVDPRTFCRSRAVDPSAGLRELRRAGVGPGRSSSSGRPPDWQRCRVTSRQPVALDDHVLGVELIARVVLPEAEGQKTAVRSPLVTAELRRRDPVGDSTRHGILRADVAARVAAGRNVRGGRRRGVARHQPALGGAVEGARDKRSGGRGGDEQPCNNDSADRLPTRPPRFDGAMRRP